MRKIIIIMSDAREEAAVAREALVRGKKKQWPEGVGTPTEPVV